MGDRLVDLHNHSTASDGTFTPSQLVALARDKNLAAIAITDHDTIDGVAEAMAAGRQLGVEVIPGVEISVDTLAPDDTPSSLHILGYFIDYENDAFKKALQARQNDRILRNQKMLEKLNKLGVCLSMEQVKRFQSKDEHMGRPHFASALVEYGWVEDIDQAFQKYLARGAKAYVHKRRLSQEEGIAIITQAGGVAALAHPAHFLQHYNYFTALLRRLKGYGMRALETYYGEYTPQQTQYLINLARKFALATCGGSDFHGANKPGLEMGKGRGQLKVPYACVTELRQKLAAQKRMPANKETIVD